MKLVLAAFLISVAARSSVAQGATGNPVAVTAFAGPAKVIGITGNDLKWGYVVGGTADYRIPDTRFGARALLSYTSYAFSGKSTPVADAKFTDTGVDIDLISWAPTENSSDARAYLTVGPSASRLTSAGTLAGVSSAFTETHFGFNVGLGFDKPIGAFAYRVDVRFRQLSFRDDTFKTIPISVGLQF